MPVRVVTLGLLLILSALPAWAGPAEPAPEPTPTQVVGDGVIVPGQRVGSIRLTMTVAQIIDLIGPGFTREEFKPEKIILYEWRQEGIWVSLDADTRAVRVISAFGVNTAYRTDRGITLLQPFTRAEATYGKEYRRWEFPADKVLLARYTAIGLQFGVVNDPGTQMVHGRIFQIGIFRPGDLPPVRQP